MQFFNSKTKSLAFFLILLLIIVSLYVTRGVLFEVSSNAISPQYGVALQIDPDEGNDAEYPDTLPTLSDLRSSGPLWVRSDWLNTQLDTQCWRDLKSLNISMLALLVQYTSASTSDPEWANKTQTFLTAAVNMAPDMPAWEVGNEVEQSWWIGGPMPASQYLQFLKMAHDTIKAVNPSAIIVGPAVACNSAGAAYLQQLIGLGVLNYLDAVSCHYYGAYGQTDFEDIKNDVDGAKPIWVTECGATTASISESDQDSYLKSTLAPSTGVLRGDSSVAVTFWYELNDVHYPPTNDDGWGLTYGSDRNYAPKQAYSTFKNFLALQTTTTATPTPPYRFTLTFPLFDR